MTVSIPHRTTSLLKCMKEFITHYNEIMVNDIFIVSEYSLAGNKKLVTILIKGPTQQICP